jgi:hypothetical protein
MDTNDSGRSELIIIDKAVIDKFVKDGGKLFFTPKAEVELLKLIDTLELLNSALADVKQRIVDSGRKVSPGFNGVLGKKIYAHFKTSGLKFKVSERSTQNEPYIKDVSYKRTFVDSKKVEEYEKEKGKLPKGIERLIQKEEFKIDFINKDEQITGQLQPLKRLEKGQD